MPYIKIGPPPPTSLAPLPPLHPLTARNLRETLPLNMLKVFKNRTGIQCRGVRGKLFEVRSLKIRFTPDLQCFAGFDTPVSADDYDCTPRGGGGEGGVLPYKSDGGVRRTFWGLKMWLWYLLGCSVLKRLQLYLLWYL